MFSCLTFVDWVLRCSSFCDFFVRGLLMVFWFDLFMFVLFCCMFVEDVGFNLIGEDVLGC